MPVLIGRLDTAGKGIEEDSGRGEREGARRSTCVQGTVCNSEEG